MQEASSPVMDRAWTSFDPGGRLLYRTLKCAMDVVVASLLLIVLSPLLIVVALAIRMEGPGPVLFKQERVRARRTRRGDEWEWRLETFPLVKFRTMHAAASDDLHRRYMAAYLAGDEEAMAAVRPGGASDGSYKLVEDPRVTRVGHVLRRFSLDELPQLWNVLRGQMTLVGPRPPLPYEVALYEDRHLSRLMGRPGLTGWWQVNGRCETSFEEMVQLDLEYIERRSIWLDLKILIRTLPATVSTKGAG